MEAPVSSGKAGFFRRNLCLPVAIPSAVMLSRCSQLTHDSTRKNQTWT